MVIIWPAMQETGSLIPKRTLQTGMPVKLRNSIENHSSVLVKEIT